MENNNFNASNFDIKYKKLDYSLKMLVYIILIVLIGCTIMSSLNAVCMRACDERLHNMRAYSYYKNKHYKNTNKNKNSKIEHFNNYGNYEYIKGTQFQRTSLYSPTNKDGTASNMMSGFAERFIRNMHNDYEYRLELKANLYELDADILQQVHKKRQIPHKYMAYFVKNGNKTPIGELKRDGDFVYKVKLLVRNDSQQIEALKHERHIIIVYEKGPVQKVVLEGKFRGK